ncbi:MAG: ATP-binding cassette domain-containing protein [Deltaproteobacteria bacterium]|jgi:ABC-type oligopeptide transport system ATPase subunit
MTTTVTDSLIELDQVTRTFALGGLLSRNRFAAVNDVSFQLPRGVPQIFAIIGESGSGKTTLARMILNLLTPSSGIIRFKGRDLKTIQSRSEKLAFMSEVQPVFQNPFSAFNPLKQVDRYLFMSAKRFADAKTQSECEQFSDRALNKVGLSLQEVKDRFPHELSGGQLQRVAIARALIAEPSLLIADEPVSMVDASLRMAIVNLFKTLRDDFKVSIIYITHDLTTAYYISDQIIIMQKGVVVESGAARSVLDHPQHPYSQLLKNSVLSPSVGSNSLLDLDSPSSH